MVLSPVNNIYRMQVVFQLQCSTALILEGWIKCSALQQSSLVGPGQNVLDLKMEIKFFHSTAKLSSPDALLFQNYE